MLKIDLINLEEIESNTASTISAFIKVVSLERTLDLSEAKLLVTQENSIHLKSITT